MDLQDKDLDIDDAFNTDEEYFSWYTLKIFTINEEKTIKELKEKIKQLGLESKIKDIELLTEYVIEESKTFSPNSEDLPKRGLKNAPHSIWVKTVNGNYKRIRLLQKRPFKGLAFIKMIYNMELFKRMTTWEMNISFLNYPNIQAISESSFLKMKNSLYQGIPDINKYIADNYYVVVEGKLKDCNEVKNNNKNLLLKRNKEKQDLQKIEKEKNQATIIANKPETKHPKTITPEFTTNNNNAINLKKLRINDHVFLNELGVIGSVQSVDPEADEVVVSVQIFGRKQPITCKSKELNLV